MRSLAELKCVPCRGGEPALSEREIKELHRLLPEWQVVEREGIQRLARDFKFGDFAQALAFTNQIGELAETVVALTNSGSKVIYQDLPTDDPKMRRPNISLAKENLGWEPKVDLEQGLRESIEYFKTELP